MHVCQGGGAAEEEEVQVKRETRGRGLKRAKLEMDEEVDAPGKPAKLSKKHKSISPSKKFKLSSN